MGQPAARLTDMHTCPMFDGPVPHVGGPIIAPCAPTVLIGALPAARITDECVCVGPPDIIAEGAPNVLISGLPAARMGDMTAHGGVIVLGDFTVLIGGGGDDDDDDDNGGDQDGSDQDGDDNGPGDGDDDGQDDQDSQDDQQAEQTDDAQKPEELHATSELGDWGNTDPVAAPGADVGADPAAAGVSGDPASAGSLPASEQAPAGAYQLGATDNNYNPSGAVDAGSVTGAGAADPFGQAVGGAPYGGGLPTGAPAPPGAFPLSASDNTYNPSGPTGAPRPSNPFLLNAIPNTYNPPASPPAPARRPPFQLGASQNAYVPAPQPPPARPTGFVPGSLSAHYESNGNPGTISGGVGDHGGVSYGSYQIIKGNLSSFVAHEGAQWPELQGQTPGSPAFNKAWKAVAANDPAGFQAAQHAYISRTHYEPQLTQLSHSTHLDINTRSHALQDVVWSTAVQHGPTTSIVSGAVHRVEAGGMNPSDPGFDRAVINAVYDERGRTRPDGTLVHFSSSSRQVQQGVANRYRSERPNALRRLGSEGG